MDNADFQKRMIEGVDKLLAQGRAAYDADGGGCLYRAPESGDACFAGGMIPDDKYDPDDEYNAASAVMPRVWGVKFTDEQEAALDDFQLAHDADATVWCEDGDAFRRSFLRIAREKMDRRGFISTFPELHAHVVKRLEALPKETA